MAAHAGTRRLLLARQASKLACLLARPLTTAQLTTAGAGWVRPSTHALSTLC